MIKKIRIIAIIVFFLVPFGYNTEPEANAGHNSALNIWDEFVVALRTGDMPEAYALLSTESKNTLSYRDFCVEWHPIGIKYNTVLSNPGYSNFAIYGSIAMIQIGLDPALNDSDNNFIRIILEKEADKWYIVDEKVQNTAICRASVTGVLQDVVKESKVLNTAFKTGKGNFSDIVRELPRIFSSERGKLALKNYNFELDLLRDGVLRATPRNKGSKGFQISQSGIISSFLPQEKTHITAEELEIIRAHKNRQSLNLHRPKQQAALAQLPAKSRRNTRLAEKDRKKSASKNNESMTLPDLPPDFPMDFQQLETATAQTPDQKRLKFLNSEEDFDLPKIKTIKNQLNTENTPAADSTEHGNLQETANTSTMAATGGNVYSNNVDLSSEELLQELELMVNEYDNEDTRLSTGGAK